MKKWFTSDWHLGDDRIGINGNPNLFYRPFISVDDQNHSIINKFVTSGFVDGDELWHLGDVLYDPEDHLYLYWLKMRFPNSKFNLVVGNYDEDKLDILEKYFDNIYTDYFVNLDFTVKGIYLNHYPIKCKQELERRDPSPWDFAITGHIHGLWKVQRNLINVGVDAWHFKPVSEDEIKFCWNAVQKFYDENVFPY